MPHDVSMTSCHHCQNVKKINISDMPLYTEIRIYVKHAKYTQPWLIELVLVIGSTSITIEFLDW